MRSAPTRRGVTLTRLGLGVAQFGNLYRETTDEQAAGAMGAAWAGGIRYFDTAPHYGLGLSERRLGRLLSDRPRSDYVVSTKVGRRLVPSPATAHLIDDEGFVVPADQRRVWDFSRDGVLRSLEGSLDRTGLDRIDIVYLHDPEDHLEVAATVAVEALIELRDQGVIGAIGAGSKYSEPLAELSRRADLDIVMIAGRFTLLDQSALDDLLPLALERGIAVVAAGVYNSGLLGRANPDPSARYEYEQVPQDLLDRAIELAAVCESHGVTLPDAALAFPLRHPAVVSVVVGGRDADQVDGTLERFARNIPDDLWVELSERGLLTDVATSGS